MAPLLAAVIMSTTVSNSSTGGNVVSQGGTVETGSSYSAVSVENDVNGNAGGSATVQVETDNNGQVSSQTITKPITPNGVDIEIATSSGNGNTSIQVSSYESGTNNAHSYVRDDGNLVTGASASTSVSASAAATTSLPPMPLVQPRFFDLFSFFKNLFSLFHW